MTERPSWPFGLTAKPTFQDKDNVQTQPQPPAQIQHPRLAPPGMGGVRTAARMGLPIAPPKPKRLEFEAGETTREFKSLAPKTPSKGHDRGR
jgi:hypothetical protein